MSETNFMIPEGMLKAVREAFQDRWEKGELGMTYASDGSSYLKHSRVAAEAVVRWLSDNPRPMDISVARELDEKYHPTFNRQVVIAQSAVEWQRRMFLAPVQSKETFG